ncbi:MAG: hypothetical protein JWQ23_2579 [Herminiimonas sp.]|nr:hypothetical protein [Herminiimonas sp.]
MTTNATSQSVSYSDNLSGGAFGKLASALFGRNAVEYLNCFREALAMSQIVGDSGVVTPRQRAQLRAMAGANSANAK